MQAISNADWPPAISTRQPAVPGAEGSEHWAERDPGPGSDRPDTVPAAEAHRTREARLGWAGTRRWGHSEAGRAETPSPPRHRAGARDADLPQLLSPARHLRAAPLPELLPAPVARHGGVTSSPCGPAAPARSLRLHSPPFPSTQAPLSAAILGQENNPAPHSPPGAAPKFEPTRSEIAAGCLRPGQWQRGGGRAVAAAPVRSGRSVRAVPAGVPRPGHSWSSGIAPRLSVWRFQTLILFDWTVQSNSSEYSLEVQNSPCEWRESSLKISGHRFITKPIIFFLLYLFCNYF